MESDDASDLQSLTPKVGVRGMTFPASFSPAFLASAVMVEVDILFRWLVKWTFYQFNEEQEARYVLDLESV